MTSKETFLKSLSGPANGAIPYADEDGPSTVANAPPRLGRSRIFAKEELMYAANHPVELQQHQFTINPHPGYRRPFPKTSGNRSTKLLTEERLESAQRRSKIGSRRSASRDVDVDTDNPLQRYENALLRYRKPGHSGLGGLRKDRREDQTFGNNGYSSSDSECPISRCNKSKSTSSIDTQSVNNILDEYEDLDYGRSSDLSDSGSISVSNFEAVMDQRKRQQLQQQQQQQPNHPARSNPTDTEEDAGKESEGQPQLHDQRARLPNERPEPVFKVNQQTQVRQRSRDRQPRDGAGKLNSGSDEPTRSNKDSNSVSTGENRSKPVPEILLRKGEVQKRVDEWLNQTQGQHFSAPNVKRESSRIVALVRSSSSAEPKHSRVARNDSRSRSTDDNAGDRLNGTASYDDINRTVASKNERKLERTKNVAANTSRGTYREYLAVRNRSRLGADYGFGVQGSGRPIESGPSRIPQRGNIGSASRRRNADEHAEGPSVPPVKQERHFLRGSRITEARAVGVSTKATSNPIPNNNATPGTPPAVVANGRTPSFKRARSHERHTGIATNRSVPLKEDQQAGNSRLRGSQQRSGSKGQVAAVEPEQPCLPNKVGESRRLLGTGWESRVPSEPACTVSPTQRQVADNGVEEDSVLHLIVRDPSPEVRDSEKDKVVKGWLDSAETHEQILIGSPKLPKLPRPRLVRENPSGLEPRKPPAPPRRDHSRRDTTEATSHIDQAPTCSSFKTAKRAYSAFRQLNEKNSFTGRDPVGHSSELSPTKSEYATPKQVEKIYGRSIEPQVIHADDLESVLKPVVRASAYGEAPESQPINNLNKHLAADKNDTNEAGDSNRDQNEGERITNSPRAARYLETGLDQCSTAHQRLPRTRNTGKEVPVEKRDLPTKCWDQEMVNKPAKTFGTFQIVSAGHGFIPPNELTNKTGKGNEDIDEAVDVTEEPTYYEPDVISKTKAAIANSYEARSTLRLDRNLTDINSRDLNNRKSPKAFIGEGPENSQHSKTDSLVSNPASSLISPGSTADIDEKKSRAVVNEVLVKNLRFQQDVPKQESPLRVGGPIMCPKPFNFNSVLSDDYEKIQAGDCPAKMGDDCKIYVTKEEMERQRLMDLLRRGDYGAVKMVNDYNVLFIDNPIGCGYSYTSNPNGYATDNAQIAADLIECIKGFLEKFPKFKKISTYIAGESYGGKMAAEFALVWDQGIIDKNGFERVLAATQNIKRLVDEENWIEATEVHDDTAVWLFDNVTGGIDFNNIIRKVRINSSGFGDSTITLTELMNNEVKKSLNVTATWEEFKYEVRNALFADLMKPVTNIVEKLLNDTDIEVVVWNGQLDLVAPPTGTLTWVENLKWSHASDWLQASRQPLLVDNVIEGYVKEYGNFKMFWVNRAGTMVPKDNPAATQEILRRLTARAE